ncbi:MAG TPA: YetF domain-containing protein [Rhizobiaceae bacterium]|nr:YetF domain-containing protein [Rhizobiaceae bacterium]
MTAQEILGSNAEHILWWQMILRGIIVFIFGLVFLRLFGRRAFGKQNPLDIVLAIIVGSNLSRAMTANAALLPTLVATAALILLFWLMEHASARWKPLGWLVKGEPIPLIRQGAPDRKAMRLAAVTEDDISEAARTSGVGNYDKVRDAVLERNGKISTMSEN